MGTMRDLLCLILGLTVIAAPYVIIGILVG